MKKQHWTLAEAVVAAASLLALFAVTLPALHGAAAQSKTALCLDNLRRIGEQFPDHVGAVHGKGLVAALHIVRPGGIEPDGEQATNIVMRCVEKGLMMFAPVGYAGASVKVSPPLSVTEEPLLEGIAVLEEAMKEICS